MKKEILYKSLGILFFPSYLLSQEIPYSAFELMEKVDHLLRYPEGLTKIQLTYIPKEGKVKIYKIALFKKEDKALFLIDSPQKGRLYKILLHEGGRKVYFYDVQGKTLWRKRGIFRYDPFLNSGFTFYDLSNLPFLEEYTPKIAGYTLEKGKKYLRVENYPLEKSAYSKVLVLFDLKEYKPQRIDYYDTNGILINQKKIQKQTLKISDKIIIGAAIIIVRV